MLGRAVRNPEFDNCPELTYQAYGVVAIYHQYSPEIDRMDAASQTTPGCGVGELEETSDKGDTPIFLNLDRGGITLTDAAGGVAFDLDADGELERVAWFAEGSGDALLVLDRNGNGWIDDGGELFGGATDQPPSDEPNGFLALAVFDREDAGGNGDGRIDASDAVYQHLRLWTDRARDGISQADELDNLAGRGVRAIDLSYVTSRSRDRHGNEFRHVSLVSFEPSVTRAVDVILRTQP